MSEKQTRCRWVANASQLDVDYHDAEWGVPVHDDRLLFECLTLEGAQAGLSWATILKKREGYREAFVNFDITRVSRFSQTRTEGLLTNPNIVRNRLKVHSTVSNAKACLAVQKEFGSFDAYLWQFVDHKPLQPRRKAAGEVPAKTELSDQLSKDLKRRDFRFVGSTICYAFMQAVGMVNDHQVSCFRHKALSEH